MKSTASKHPRLLPDVLQAIADLDDDHGSNTRTIIDQVESSHLNAGEKQKNVTTEVRRALKHAVDTGLLKQRAGKFRIGNPMELSRIFDKNSQCDTCSRKDKHAKKKRGGAKRARMMHSSVSSVATSETGSYSEFDSDHTVRTSRSHHVPRSSGFVDRSRGKRKRKPRKGRSRGHRSKRRRSRSSSLTKDEDSVTGGSPRQEVKSNELRPKCHLQNCDNPNCICSYKQASIEDLSKQDKMHENYII